MVIGQVNGTCKAKEDRMKKYLKKVARLVKKFKEADFVQIPREENMEVNTLTKEASANEAMDELDEVQYMPSMELPEMLQIHPNSVILEGWKASRGEGRSQEAQGQVSQVHPYGRSVIQKRFFPTFPKVFSSGRGELHIKRGS